jgi:tetratricopeptide (TPR) repeat protein
LAEDFSRGFREIYNRKNLALDSNEYYFKAREYHDKNYYASALANYEAALQMITWGAFYYHYGNCLMDIGDYESAEKSFRKAIKFIHYYSPYEKFVLYYYEGDRNPIYSFDNNGIVRELYFSYYNLACIYSLADRLEDSFENLILAIENGYPYLDHIFTDTDLENLFNSPNSAQIRSDINRIHSLGIINNVAGKTFYYRSSPNDLVQYEFIDDIHILRHDLASDDLRRVLFGTYNVTNYHVIINYNRETGSEGYGDTYNMGVNTGYSDYEPYDRNIDVMEYISLKKMEVEGEWGWTEKWPW